MGTRMNMATFAELKSTARKLNIPATVHSFLPKLALNPGAMTFEQIVELFEDSARQPTKVQIVLLVKIVEQAAIDYPETKKGSTGSKKKKAEDLPPIQVEKPEKKTSTKEPVADQEETPAKAPSTEKPVEYIRELEPEEITEDVTPVEQFNMSDYEQVSLSLSADRSPQTLNISSSGNKTTVSWSKANSSDAVFVLAASNTSMPSVIKGADAIEATRENQITISGTFKYYKLFEFLAPKTKGQPIASGQVLGDITELVIETYPHEVRIRWNSSDLSAAVAIYKSKANSALPSNLTAEYKLDIARGTSNHTDRNVQPGQSFEYCAVLESQTVSGTVQASSGMRQTVAIPGDVPKVENFKVEFDSDHETVNISYTRPKLALAKIKVFQIPGVPSANLKAALADEMVIPFERLKQQDIEDWLGKEIIESEISAEETPNILEMRRIPLRDPEKKGSVTYVAVSTLGSDALISRIEVLHLVGSIGELTLLDRYDYQILRTEVPEGAILLKVYQAPPEASFEEAKSNPPRNVVVATEYRRFGGIVWGDDIPGVSGVNRLPVTPMRIWVEGVAMYDGKPHSGAARSIDYPGRVEVNYHLEPANKEGTAEAAPKKKLFGNKNAEPKKPKDPNRIVKVKIGAPSRTGDLKFTIRTAPKGIFHLDESSSTSTPEKVTFLEENFKLDKEVILDSTRQPFVFNSDTYDFRLKSVGVSETDTPRFIIDSVISKLSKPLEETQPQKRTLSVAILGAKQSGKTTYLQALLNYFDQQFSAKYSTKLAAPVGNAVSEARLNDLREFIQSGTLPEATKSAANVERGSERDPRKPIQFEFGGNASPIAGIDIYDLAGEDMDSYKSMSLYKSELAKVDLIILLVDPMQVTSMEQVLRGAVAAPPKGTAPFVVLQNLEQILSESDSGVPSHKLAVVVSKFDGIEIAAEMEGTPVYGMLDKGLSLTRDVNTNSTKRYNERDGITLDRQVMGLINKFDDMAAFTRALADSTVFAEKRCFVVSSLGHSTDATRMDKAGITSFRISDPILWALEG
jgi:hypothetical protein